MNKKDMGVDETVWALYQWPFVIGTAQNGSHEVINRVNTPCGICNNGQTCNILTHPTSYTALSRPMSTSTASVCLPTVYV